MAKTKVINIFFTALIIISAATILGGCTSRDIAGIEINTQPPTRINIDGKEAGMSPYKNKSVKAGPIDIKIGQEGIGFWRKKLELKKNLGIAINWTFGSGDEYSGGYVLSMEKSSGKGSGIIISSSPAKATVLIGGENRGRTPMYVADLGEGDKEIKISLPGYESINLGVRPVPGHQIILEAMMAKEKRVVVATPTPTIAPVGLGTRIRIKTTDTGWLRVRDLPSSAGLEIDKVNVGETYDSVGESNGWTHIIVREKQGWVSSQFVERI